MPKKSKNKNKLRGRELAKRLGPSHDMYWVYHGQNSLVFISPQGLEEACMKHLTEQGRARPWQPLGEVRAKQYTSLATFDNRKIHGAAWAHVDQGAKHVRFFCINMDRDCPEIDEFHDLIRDHPWTAKGRTGKIFTFEQRMKTSGQGAEGDHESPYNVVFMNTWGDTWEASVTKYKDVTQATDNGMRHIWVRSNSSRSGGFKSQAMCNMLCHIGGFTSCYPGGPGGNYGGIQQGGTPMATKGKAASSSHTTVEKRLPMPTRPSPEGPEVTAVEK